MTYIFSNCMTNLKYNIEDLNIKKDDKLVFINTAYLLKNNLEYFKQFENIFYFARGIRSHGYRYEDDATGKFYEDTHKVFNNFKKNYGIKYGWGGKELIDIDNNETISLEGLLNYPKKLFPTTGYICYKLFQAWDKKDPILVNFFNDNTSKNVVRKSSTKDMAGCHSWSFEKEALKNAKKIFLW